MPKETNVNLSCLLSGFADKARKVKSDIGKKMDGATSFFSKLANGDVIVGKDGILLYPGKVVSIDGRESENAKIIGFDKFNPNGNATLSSTNNDGKSYSVPIASLGRKKDIVVPDKQATDEYHNG